MATASFPIRIGARSRLLLRVFGVQSGNAVVSIGDELDARFGWFRMSTPISNIRSWRLDGPYRWITAIGVRRGIRAGDITFAGGTEGGVRIDFVERVRWGLLRVPTLYVTVEDQDAFASALTARGIPGTDRRGDGR
jgi:hypothetical protein